MRFGLVFPVLLALLLTATAGAHTGHGDKPALATPPAPAELDMYGVEPPTGSRGPELLGEGLLVPEPTAAPEAGPPAGHPMKMHEPHVAPAEHRMVSTAAKGYGVAAGITVLCGLLFGALTLIRPFE